MLNRIEARHLPIKSEDGPEIPAKPRPSQPVQAAIQNAAQTPRLTAPDPLAVALMGDQFGEKFAAHYYAARSAAFQVRGQEFLGHYRALKRLAKEQGMSGEDFGAFERCLYRHFYRAACRDTISRVQAGDELKVQSHELAYIAEVAGIAAPQLERDALALRRGHCLGQMRAIAARRLA